MGPDDRQGDQHPLLVWFEYAHLPEGPMQNVSQLFADLALLVDANVNDGAEKTVCLRKLLEAKDAGVRATLETIRYFATQEVVEEQVISEDEARRAAAQAAIDAGALICPECLQGKHQNCTGTIPVGVNDSMPCRCANGCGSPVQ